MRPLGWLLLACSVGVGAGAILLGWMEFATAALVAGLVVIQSALFLIGRTAYDIRIALNRTRVVAGERAYGSLTVTNPTARALPPARLVLPVGPGRGAFDIPRMSAGETRDDLFSIPTTARGTLAVGPVSVLRGDPLGLFERISHRDDARTLYVHPITVALTGLSLGRVRDLEGLPTSDLSRDDLSFHALREYSPGDDLRHVHWRSTARVGAVLVRQYEETRRSRFVVGLSAHPDDYSDPDEFELAVSIAASFGIHVLADSRDLAVLMPGRVLTESSGARLLDEFSLISLSPAGGGGIDALAVRIAPHANQAALVILVSGAQASPAALQAACGRMPAGVRTLVVVADPEAEAVRRRVGGADVIHIPTLEELPRAVRRVLS
ncbi:DUF58 domain-containing protein [Microbacterium sp. ZW T5_56]|uniref:DUF58 domain-containing protein n=1 Tax=Microbacterium sp. ZW T5_56 TaxID=3378081 RepID=UPI0038520EE1